MGPRSGLDYIALHISLYFPDFLWPWSVRGFIVCIYQNHIFLHRFWCKRYTSLSVISQMSKSSIDCSEWTEDAFFIALEFDFRWPSKFFSRISLTLIMYTGGPWIRRFQSVRFPV